MSEHAPRWAEIESIALSRFGVTSFRPGQRELIDAVFAGRDALGILPTGGGKSLCFQLPSLFLPKLVLVITPLISLAEDQTDKLEAFDIAATRLDSTLTAREMREAVSSVNSGKLELLYVTPERLQNEEFMRRVQQLGVSLVVVDEAHCVSQWGHDFRPAYLSIRHAMQALGHPPLLALTATATPRVEADIVAQLAMRDPVRIRTSAERKNIHIDVEHANNDTEKHQALTRILSEESGKPGLIYTATIRTATNIWNQLVARDVPAGLYHGKLHPAVRDATQDAFMDGRYSIVVATKAFGMGIDKKDTRFVVHYEVPDSIESYYQELGRAGRDGLPARAILLFCLSDTRVQQYFLTRKYPGARDLQTACDWLAEQPLNSDLDAKTLETALSERTATIVLSGLERLQLIERHGSTWRRTNVDVNSATKALASVYQGKRTEDRKRLTDMIDYAALATCRTAHILKYFGEDSAASCTHCDNCGHAHHTRAVVRRRRPAMG